MDALWIFVTPEGGRIKGMNAPVLDNLAWLGTSKLCELYEAIVTGGVTEADIPGKPAEFAMPNVLVRLSLEHDRMFTY